MIINFFLPGLGDSGGIQVVKRYAYMLNNRENDVVIYCSIISPNLHRYKSPVINIIHQVYCTLKTIPNIFLRKKGGVHWIPIISQKFIRKSDINIATTWTTAFQVAKLRDSARKAYFIQDYEIWDNEKLGNRSYKLPLEHIVIAKWIDDILVNKLGCKPSYIVHNGIDTNFFYPNEPKKKIRQMDGQIQCLMLYHKLEKKGIKDGVKAFKLARQKITNLKLVMFGLPKNPNIDVVSTYYQNPSKNQLLELYQSSDIFIFPPREEGWGLTPIEAMASGCPVVGTDVGCMTEIGKNRCNVLLSTSEKPEELAQNIVMLCKDTVLKHELEFEGRRTALELSWGESVIFFENALKHICNNNS